MADKNPSKPGAAFVKIVAIIVPVAAIAVVAWYWEPISFYFKLHQWDPDAPSRTVSAFLEAGKKGDKAGADRLLGNPELQPLEQNGKWAGYKVVSIAGTLLYRMADLTPASGTKAKETEFTYVDPGAAMVTMPDAKAKDVKYRLKMLGNEWKITEIRGGTLAK